MKTIADLKNWLNENGYPEGAADIERMETDEEYAEKVGFGYSHSDNLRQLLYRLFYWETSWLGVDYWHKVAEKLWKYEDD